jgi:hypothetical protein
MPTDEADVLANELERTHPKVGLVFEREGTFIQTILKRPATETSSRDMRVPLELRPGGKFGHFNPDGGGLGRGTGPKFDKGLIPVAYTKMGVEWTRKSDWATDSARKAVLSTFRHLVATSMAEYRKHMDNLAMGDGTGTVGTITAVSTAGGKDTYTFDDVTGDGFDIRLLRDASFYSVYNAALTVRKPFSTLGAVAGEGPIEFYDIGNKQVRFNATVAAPAIPSDKLVVSGLTATPPVSLLGVLYHHSDASTGTWLGLDRATIPSVRANRVNAAGAAFALPFARQAINKSGNRVGKDALSSMKAWMHPVQQDAYERTGQLVSVINMTTKSQGLNMYFDQNNMQLAGAPVRTHFSWNKRRIDFIVESNWGRSEVQPVGYYTDKQGRKFFEIRDTDGGIAAADIFYICSGMNIFVMNPSGETYIDGLAIPSGY